MHACLSTPVARARRTLFTVCAIAAASYASVTHGGDLRVTVLTPTGQPANAASVCAGTPQQPTQYGSATANTSGVAILRGVPTGPVQVTAHFGQSGHALVHQMGSAAQESVTVRLPVAPTMKTCGASVDGGLPGNPRIGTSRTPAPTNLKLGNVERPTARLTPSNIPRVPVKTEYCFGALGAECGGAQYNLPTTALCAAGLCQINAGSWEHDECCFAHPNGMACRLGPLDYATGHNGKCVKEWDKALARLGDGLSWTRRIDFGKPNSTGRVEFSAYCAPTGTRVPLEDVRYCCSRQADPVPALFGIPSNLRACR